ncbi:imidazole glycerol phosphate synthase subunit HisH [Lutibaculum baratangense]|nr:imidazole glycerol phosphate synthase subunit HisH [Lutibaculum baratangense]
MKLAVVDYGSGNLRSAEKALERAAAEAGIGASIAVTDDPDAVAAADRIVLPGVGAFADCMRGLAAVPGLREALEEAVRGKRRPFLGICVGMQLMAERGLEHETSDGLGWIGGDVVRLEPADVSLKIPQMGWNRLVFHGKHHILDGLDAGGSAYAYFVHSYHLKARDPGDVVATVDYGGPVTAIVARDNMIGSQFHPEKSQRVGLKLLSNFLKWNP